MQASDEFVVHASSPLSPTVTHISIIVTNPHALILIPRALSFIQQASFLAPPSLIHICLCVICRTPSPGEKLYV